MFGQGICCWSSRTRLSGQRGKSLSSRSRRCWLTWAKWRTMDWLAKLAETTSADIERSVCAKMHGRVSSLLRLQGSGVRSGTCAYDAILQMVRPEVMTVRMLKPQGDLKGGEQPRLELPRVKATTYPLSHRSGCGIAFTTASQH